MRNFFRELQRRKVYTIGVAYVIVGWLLLQVADTVLPIYDAPEWVLRTFTTLLFLGFPVALVLAWIYDLSNGKIVRTPDEPEPAMDDIIELPTGPSIAVLPFRNLSSDSDQDLFAGGWVWETDAELIELVGDMYVARTWIDPSNTVELAFAVEPRPR